MNKQMLTSIMKKILHLNLLILLLLLSISLIADNSIVGKIKVGKIKFIRGTAAAQSTHKDMRMLGMGDSVYKGDMIQTSKGSFVIIIFNDKSKITLKPNSNFSIVEFINKKNQHKASFKLHNGGLKASSGEIAKKTKNNYTIKTAMGDINAQDADYSVQLCNEDCSNNKVTQPKKKSQQLVGKVVELKGKVIAERNSQINNNGSIILQKGSPLYQHDTIKSDPDSYVVLVFRDGGRITLSASSEMDISRYHFAEKQQQDSAVFKLVKGGLSALSGTIGKDNHEDYKIETPVASIGIRGTLFDLFCIGNCLESGLFSRVNQGEITQTNSSGVFVLLEHSINNILNQNSGPRPLNSLPRIFLSQMGIRPDKIKVNIKALFNTTAVKNIAPGLYVVVKKGKVSLKGKASNGGSNSVLNLGAGRASFIGSNNGNTIPIIIPIFPFQSTVPYPNQFNLKTINSRYSILLDNINQNVIIGRFQCRS